ncbi:trans-sialidase, putative [Trypanosoma cruzi marinkellei]|uniref:Trans-sialidase, putative n=1 Tax=Trypanosoma cruzi marinkellei TaxID=85056 RepID=K2PEX6_TRYCR|nr:trans-sialidase, putative [Trypanosoma cruzi marinkellei]
MLSRVAAVMAPRTHNRRRVTGSSGRRREGRESERQRPNMSRRLFYSAVLPLVVVMWMCCNNCGAAPAEDSNSRDVQLPERVGVFLPQRTPVLPKEGAGPGEVKDSFNSPSVVSAGGVMVAIAEAWKEFPDPWSPTNVVEDADIVAGYINATEPWSSIAAEITSNKWNAHTVFAREAIKDGLRTAIRPTSLSKGNKLFFIVGSYLSTFDSTKQDWVNHDFDISVVTGEAMPSREGDPNKGILWGTPQSLFALITARTEHLGLNTFFGAGGSGILLENGWLVFPLTALREMVDTVFIIFSKNDGVDWEVATGTPPGYCTESLIFEWERKIMMIVEIVGGRKVFESVDMGNTWTEAPGILTRVRNRGPDSRDASFRVGALIIATIGRTKVMLYTQKGRLLGESKATAHYLWLTDNNRTLPLGPISVDDEKESTFSNSLLFSNNMLYFLHERGDRRNDGVFLSPLKEELDRINSIVNIWVLMDIFFSESSIPTDGLVAFLSDSATPNTWLDMYQCVNATVTNARKVPYGFKFSGPGSKGIWPVNRGELNRQYSFVDYNFSLVATAIIAATPTENTPLLGASLEDLGATNFIGLSCTVDKRWETVLNGAKTTSSKTCEPGKEHQVAIMLQDNRGVVCVDGEIVGSSETMSTLGTRAVQVSDFYFGGGKGENSVTLKDVFLYNRPLSFAELRKISKTDSSCMRGSISWLLLLGLWGFAALYGV